MPRTARPIAVAGACAEASPAPARASDPDHDQAKPHRRRLRVTRRAVRARARLFGSCKSLQIGSLSAVASIGPWSAASSPRGLVALVAALVLARRRSPATQLLPGVTLRASVQFTPHGPVALHVVRGPRPTGLYRLRPVLSNETVLGRERVTSMQRRLSSQATSVGRQRRLLLLADGRPSGILVRDGVLVTPPNPTRSSAGVDARRHARHPQDRVPRHLARARRAPAADRDQQGARHERDRALHLRLGSA